MTRKFFQVKKVAPCNCMIATTCIISHTYNKLKLINVTSIILDQYTVSKQDLHTNLCTVELPNNGHLGSRPFVLYMEVVPL